MARTIEKIITGVKASDGDGVQLTRVIASPQLDMLDPFLLMDVFGSDKPQEYIGGFPSHPHRGFETVTYMLAGKMRHKDSVGNAGVIETGGVQWMSAARGIIHSEMPEQEKGLLAGFQLWVNLPAAHKMDQPSYQEYAADKIPEELREDGIHLKVVAGRTKYGTEGVIKNNVVDPVYWDVSMPQHTRFIDEIPKGYNAFIYVIEGELILTGSETDSSPDSKTNNTAVEKQLAVLSLGKGINIEAKSSSRFLLIAGKPLNEPVARGGPFVMNTREEIQQAFADYESGQLTA